MSTIEEDLRENFEEFFVQAFKFANPDTELIFSPYLQYICERYQNIRKRDRVIFNQPARSMKSWTAKIYAAWYLGRNPGKNVMIVSNKQDLAELNLIDVRDILRAPWYKKVFPETRIAKGRSSKTQFVTTRRGGVLAVSVEGSVAGFGADLMIIDDPNKIADASRPDRHQTVNDKFDGELYSRLNNKKKSIVIVVQHRLHENDLSGHLIRRGYAVIALPLVAPRDKDYPLRDGEVWHRKKGNVLTATYLLKDIEAAKKSNALDYFWFYQQGVGPKQAKNIRIEDFKILKSNKEAGPFLISIDAAQGDGPQHSFNVVQVWQQLPGSYHLFHQFREQCGFAQFQTATKSLIKAFRPAAVLIESAANGGALLSVLRGQLPAFNFIGIHPSETKMERLNRHREAIRRGALSLQSTEGWIVDFLLEFNDFPRRGTDMVDTTTQMLDYAEKNPIWHSVPARGAAMGGVRSDGRPITLVSSTESGPPGIAIARGIPFFRRF
jgi:phage terminase large subunit-like protein